MEPRMEPPLRPSGPEARDCRVVANARVALAELQRHKPHSLRRIRFHPVIETAAGAVRTRPLRDEQRDFTP